MIIRSLEQPTYNRKHKGGLPGFGPSKKTTDQSGKSFEDFLTEAFQGEVVQEGSWTSANLTDLTRRNLHKI